MRFCIAIALLVVFCCSVSYIDSATRQPDPVTMVGGCQ